jgi:AraC-like DNA-binding protein
MPDAPASAPPSPSVLSYTMQNVPARRRFAVMRDMMADGNPPFIRAVLTAAREDPEAPFDAGVHVRTAGELLCSEHYCDAVSYTRSARGIATSPIEVYSLQLQVEGVTHFTQGGQTLTRTPGQLLLLDGNEPFQAVMAGWVRHRAIRIPRQMLDSMMVAGWQRHGIVCAAEPGLGSLLRQYATVLIEQTEQFNAAEGGPVLENLCRLLALYAGTQTKYAGPADRALGAARLVQVRRYIDQHLADPELTPALVAAAHRMSLRSLHLLFEPTGVSFARHVLWRRLQECHAMLASPAQLHRSVTDIAFAWGFNSLTTFYGAFQRQFGVAPGELRRSAGSGKVAPFERPGRRY